MEEKNDKPVEEPKKETVNGAEEKKQEPEKATATVQNKGKAIMEGNNNFSSGKKPVDSSKDALRKRLFLLAVVIVVVVVVMLIIMAIASSTKGKTLTYDQIEAEMKNAAMEFYQVQSSLLPEEDGETAEVSVETLSSSEYHLMSPLSESRPGEDCSGRVVVEKVGDNYVYTPYLDCGDNYSTKELYQAVLETGIDSRGNGLYEMNGEHVFRGEYVNNYVQLDEAVYRIVKVMNDNRIMLILDDVSESLLGAAWDNRYNSTLGYDGGINNYHLSRMYEYLKTFYESGYSDIVILSDNDKEKLVPFDLCIGKRSESETNNTNQVECSEVLEDQMMGLLTVSDYVNASLDTNCQASGDRACKNYNYLVTSRNEWWLVTASSESTSEVYSVTTSGYVQATDANDYRRMRPVIMLNSNVMIQSGTGTAEDPYILK